MNATVVASPRVSRQPAAAAETAPPPASALARISGIVLFAFSFALAAFVVANKHAVDSLLHAAGIGAYPLAIAIFTLVASAPFSVTDALAVSNGVLFGPWLGSLINAIGLVLASMLSYVIARRTSKLLAVDSQIERLPAWVLRFQVGSPLFLIFVRVIPGVGGTLATQIAAAFRVPLLRHMLTFCAVTVPFCTLLAFGGNAISAYVEHKIIGPAEHYAKTHHVSFPQRHHHP